MSKLNSMIFFKLLIILSYSSFKSKLLLITKYIEKMTKCMRVKSKTLYTFVLREHQLLL